VVLQAPEELMFETQRAYFARHCLLLLAKRRALSIERYPDPSNIG
jgi:hypothetical protein